MRKSTIYSWIIITFVVTAPVFSQTPQTTVTINTNEIINNDYIGNGAEWDPYQLDYGKITFNASDIDWRKLYARLDFMRPQFMRVMINTPSLVRDGRLDPKMNYDQMAKILGYCQSRGVTVVFGDWGDGMVNSKTGKINRKNLTYAAQYVGFLINQKGFTCIKYYNMINEPNGYWSAADGSYPLWAKAVKYFYKKLKEEDPDGKLSIMGPDAAIWSAKESWWVDSCATDLGRMIGLYDIHTYPSKSTVNSGKYSQVIKAYQKEVPDGSKIVIGEIGLKFVAPQDSLLQKENIRRAKAKPYASTEDSQMFVYDYSYGTDMADALFQAVNAGYSGAVVWMLDDAMHSKEAKDKLKVWGFWNILGDEFFGSKEEDVRPWYYAWSLLSKYMPAGSQIFKVKVSGDNTVKAITAGKDGKYMLAAVNVAKVEKKVRIQSSTLPALGNVKQFVYSDGTLIKEGDHGLQPNRKALTLDLAGGVTLVMPPESIIIYTNYAY